MEEEKELEELSEDALKLLALLRRFENKENIAQIEYELNDVFSCYAFLKVCGEELIEHGEKFNLVKKLVALHKDAKAHRLPNGEHCGNC